MLNISETKHIQLQSINHYMHKYYKSIVSISLDFFARHATAQVNLDHQSSLFTFQYNMNTNIKINVRLK